MFPLSVKLPVFLFQEEGQYIADFPPLGVAAQGTSEEDAVHHFVEIMAITLDICSERGTLEEILDQAGFTKLPTGEIIPPSLDDHAQAHPQPSRVRDVTISSPWWNHFHAGIDQLAHAC